MKLIAFGDITLNRLQQKDIEMLRLWRNDKKITERMFFRDEITSEMQQKWFNQLNPTKDFYFIIHYKNEPIGLTHLSNINDEKNSGSVGLFIYNEHYWGTHLPIQASLSLLNFAFNFQKLENVIAKVLPNNKAAIRYNESLGFVFKGEEYMILNKKNYQSVTLKLQTTMEKMLHTKIHLS